MIIALNTCKFWLSPAVPFSRSYSMVSWTAASVRSAGWVAPWLMSWVSERGWPGFASVLSHCICMPWPGFLSSLCLGFLIYKMAIIIVLTHRVAWRMNQIMPEKYSAQYLHVIHGCYLLLLRDLWQISLRNAMLSKVKSVSLLMDFFEPSLSPDTINLWEGEESMKRFPDLIDHRASASSKMS